MGGIIRNPADKSDLVAGALAALQVILDIEDGVAAANALLALAVLGLGREQLLAEGSVVVVSRLLLDDNLGPVVANPVDDPLERLAQLQVVEDGDAFGCDGNAGRGLAIAASVSEKCFGLYARWTVRGVAEGKRVIRELVHTMIVVGVRLEECGED